MDRRCASCSAFRLRLRRTLRDRRPAPPIRVRLTGRALVAGTRRRERDHDGSCDGDGDRDGRWAFPRPLPSLSLLTSPAVARARPVRPRRDLASTPAAPVPAPTPTARGGGTSFARRLPPCAGALSSFRVPSAANLCICASSSATRRCHVCEAHGGAGHAFAISHDQSVALELVARPTPPSPCAHGKHVPPHAAQWPPTACCTGPEPVCWHAVRAPAATRQSSSVPPHCCSQSRVSAHVACHLVALVEPHVEARQLSSTPATDRGSGEHGRRAGLSRPVVQPTRHLTTGVALRHPVTRRRASPLWFVPWRHAWRRWRSHLPAGTTSRWCGARRRWRASRLLVCCIFVVLQ